MHGIRDVDDGELSLDRSIDRAKLTFTSSRLLSVLQIATDLNLILLRLILEQLRAHGVCCIQTLYSEHCVLELYHL